MSANAYGLISTVFIGLVGAWIAYSQMRIAKEKLRADLYDRRFAIYLAFQRMIVAVIEEASSDDPEKVMDFIRVATIAKAGGPFLLGAELTSYLEQLQEKAFKVHKTLRLLPENREFYDVLSFRQAASKQTDDKLYLLQEVNRMQETFLSKLSLQDLHDVRSTWRHAFFGIRSKMHKKAS